MVIDGLTWPGLGVGTMALTCLAIAIHGFFDSDPLLVLDREGMSFRGLTQQIPWKQVKKVELKIPILPSKAQTLFNQKHLVVQVKNPNQFSSASTLDDLNRTFLDTNGLYINLALGEISSEAAKDLIEKYRSEFG